MCGPPPMVKFACKANLDALGYAKTDQLSFWRESPVKSHLSIRTGNKVPSLCDEAYHFFFFFSFVGHAS